MDYDKIDVEAGVNAPVNAVEHGETRPATQQESLAVRLAALNDIVHDMQTIIKAGKNAVHV